jgi:neutral ceramidase
VSKRNPEVKWFVGIARRTITPPPGVELAGLGYFLKRTWNSVHDDLNVSAFVVDDSQGASAAIVSLDLLSMDAEYVQAIRKGVSIQTPLNGISVCINCSHSHNAPTMGFFDGAGEIDRDYALWVVNSTIEAIVEAWHKRVPASLYVGWQLLPDVTYNRTREHGPVDDRVSVLRADRLDGRPLAVVVNFHAHPTVFWQVDPRAVSRDAPGHIVDLIERELPGAMAMYLQGSCGDVNFRLDFWTPEHFREAGLAVFEAARTAWSHSRKIETSGIESVVHQIDLPARRWTREEVLELYEEGQYRLSTGDTRGWLNGIASKMVGIPARLPERYGGSVEKAVEAVSQFVVRWGNETLPKLDVMPEMRNAEFQAIRLGDAWISANQAELFSSLALELRRGWPHQDLFVLGYSNGSISYLPDAEEVDRGSYASLHVPKAVRALPFTRDAGMSAVRASLSVLAGTEELLVAAKSP